MKKLKTVMLSVLTLLLLSNTSSFAQSPDKCYEEDINITFPYYTLSEYNSSSSDVNGSQKVRFDDKDKTFGKIYWDSKCHLWYIYGFKENKKYYYKNEKDAVQALYAYKTLYCVLQSGFYGTNLENCR